MQLLLAWVGQCCSQLGVLQWLHAAISGIFEVRGCIGTPASLVRDWPLELLWDTMNLEQKLGVLTFVGHPAPDVPA